MSTTLPKIFTTFKRQLQQGMAKEILINQFLTQRMKCDLTEPYDEDCWIAMPSDIYAHLAHYTTVKTNKMRLNRLKKLLKIEKHESLRIAISPSYTLLIENSSDALLVSLDDSGDCTLCLTHLSPLSIATWIARQIQNFDGYMAEWDSICEQVLKKEKQNRMAALAIKAIVTERMKEFPQVKYVMYEQGRRVKLRVMLPETNLGIHIYAYYASYKKRLPVDFENLKQLVEALADCAIKKFFTYMK